MHRHTTFQRGLWTLVLAALTVTAVAATGSSAAAQPGNQQRNQQSDVNVSASVSPKEVEIGGTVDFNVEVSVRGNRSISVKSRPDVGSAFHVVGRSQSPQFMMRNGVTRRSLSVTYRLQARETGEYKLTPPLFSVDGTKYQAPEQTVTVVERGQARNPRNQGNQPRARRPSESDKIFLHSELSPTKKPYLGQQVTLTYHLMTDPHAFNVRPHPPTEPSLDSFWIEDLSERVAGQNSMTNLRGRFLEKTTLRAYALFPLETGPTTVDPMNVKVEVGGFFSKNRMELASDPLELEVRPLPDGAPDGFYEGNVGDWKFRADLEGNRTELGSPVTLKMVVVGEGNIRRVKLPEPDGVDGLVLDQNDETVDKKIRNLKIAGRKVIEYTVSPRREGHFEIPAVEFSYFDPEAETYRTEKAGPFGLEVRGGTLPKRLKDDGDGRATGGAAAAAVANDEDAKNEDPIARLLADLGAPVRNIDHFSRGAATWRKPVFLAAVGIPTTGLLLLLFFPVVLRNFRAVRRRSSHHKKARREAMEAIEQAREAALGEAPEDVARALRLYLHIGLDVPKGSVTKSEVGAHLDQRGVADDTRREIEAILEWSDEARFAPAARLDNERVSLMIDRCEAVVEALFAARSDDTDDTGGGSSPNAGTAAVLLVGALAASVVTVIGAGKLTAGDDFQARVDRAIEAHQSEDWSKAADTWAELLQARPEHPALLYNLGTARAHQRQFGPARASLEQTALLRPTAQTRHNLDIIDKIVERTRIEQARGTQFAPPGAAPGLTRWRLARSIPHSLPPWSLAVGLWLLFLGLAARTLGEAGSRLRLLGTSALAAGLVVASLAALTWGGRTWTLQTVKPAVITADRPDLRTAPTRHAELQSPELPLVAGVTGRVLDRRDGWTELELDSDLSGWVHSDAIDMIE